MTGFFNTVALTASNAPANNDVAAIAIWMVVGIFVAGAWLAFFNHQWVAYSENPTKITRREMQIAIFAPITVPILVGMLIAKMVRNVNAVAA